MTWTRTSSRSKVRECYSLKNREFEREVLKQGALAALSLSSRTLGPAPEQNLGRTDKPKRVVVIGAGLAGLAATHQLAGAGHDVTSLEATMRPGGLVQTLREPFSDGLWADAGAMFIPENHELTLRYLRPFNLPSSRSFPQGLVRVYYLRCRRFIVGEGEEAAWPFNLTPAERSLALNGMRQKHVIPGA